MQNEYRLLDCGNQQKLEIFGEYKIIRPCTQAFWDKKDPELWKDIDAEYIRTDQNKGFWKKHNTELPHYWFINSNGLNWKIEPNEFGNLGVFTEHWTYSNRLQDFFDAKEKVLNLFSYTGSSTLHLAKAGYQITAVDASKNAMTNYVENLKKNQIKAENGQRLILEDIRKFVQKEIRRKNQYASIILDPPSFGRGTKGEVFNLEKDLKSLLLDLQQLLKKDGKLVLTMHSPKFTNSILEFLLKQIFVNKNIKVEEILNPCQSGIGLPSGFLAWVW
jgi:23S rRNA (cytosine1962-C5)-methyltransferase